MKQNTSELTRTKLKLQQQEENKSSQKVFNYEFLGNILIILSGVLPFIHVIVPDEPLVDKFFGYTSIHRFLYSVGTHGSLLLLASGVFIIIAILGKKEDNAITLKHLRLSLYSPCLSALFFISWVFIPDINYNLLAYVFFGIFVIIIGAYILFRVKEYLQYLRQVHDYKEMILNESLEFISHKLDNKS
ncbi:hypothetical protein IMCC3317_20920 [Kordia antarctica]|uniref:Uncharacterized protein n=1 Tax=Kordia antarctica TaxID=1218801 RepID=A0A7L4ZJB5_9FLAO|nr:hypothetical protein [Kordia antarctica]QHI36722.1 hypothetical protein IMCC3317_20920 [Kordia antarctica]